jgi:MFS family permease
LLIAGCGTIIVVTSSNMLLQSLVPDNLRTQVMAFYYMSFSGMLPVASLADGALAHQIGVEPVFALSGALFACLGYNLYRKLPELRKASYPVLREKGLLRPSCPESELR